MEKVVLIILLLQGEILKKTLYDPFIDVLNNLESDDAIPAKKQECDCHFKKKIMKIMDNCGARAFYNSNPIFYEWMVELRCLNISPPKEMKEQFDRMLTKARNRFNRGKSGKALLSEIRRL